MLNETTQEMKIYNIKKEKNYRKAANNGLTCRNCFISYLDYDVFQARNKGQDIKCISQRWCSEGHKVKNNYTCDKIKGVRNGKHNR